MPFAPSFQALIPLLLEGDEIGYEFMLHEEIYVLRLYTDDGAIYRVELIGERRELLGAHLRKEIPVQMARDLGLLDNQVIQPIPWVLYENIIELYEHTKQ